MAAIGRGVRRAAGARQAALVLAAALASGCALAPASSAVDRLAPCAVDDGPVDAYCGTLRVFEDRAAGSGRTIDLSIVVLPALGARPEPDPVFFLAGGPGQAAARMAEAAGGLFARVQASRDIVLVDQRGTGRSNGLECESDDDSLAALVEPDAAVLARLRTCLDGYDADPRLYTTSVAMDDLDDVRAFLGYERVNLYGGSYGTRAALVYLRQHPSRVRSVILDGVAPPDMRLPLFFARDGQRALDLLLADCAADEGCAARYPDLAARVRGLVERLERAPVEARLVHPRTGVAETIRVDARLIANLVFGALYSPLASSIVPELLARAEAGDYQGLLALGMLSEPGDGRISVGMQLSVVCAEDAPRVQPGDLESAAAGTVFAGRLLTAQLEACAFWPRGEVPAGYYAPVVSDAPTLLLSGALDPVTPPSWGDQVAAHLSRSRHIVMPNTGHGVIATGCGQRLVEAFIEQGAVEGLDDGCVGRQTRPPFVLSPAGPTP